MNYLSEEMLFTELVTYGWIDVNGVLVIFDGDHDLRLARYVASLSKEIQGNLILCWEHEGFALFYWKRTGCPHIHDEGIAVEDDWWSCEHNFLTKDTVLDVPKIIDRLQEKYSSLSNAEFEEWLNK